MKVLVLLVALVGAVACGPAEEGEKPSGTPATPEEAPAPAFGFFTRHGRRVDLRDGIAVFRPAQKALFLNLTDGSWTKSTREAVRWDEVTCENATPLWQHETLELKLRLDDGLRLASWSATLWIPDEPPLNLYSDGSSGRVKELELAWSGPGEAPLDLRFAYESGDDGWDLDLTGLPVEVAEPKAEAEVDRTALLAEVRTSNPVLELLAEMPEGASISPWFSEHAAVLAGRRARGLARAELVVVIPDPDWKSFAVELHLHGLELGEWRNLNVVIEPTYFTCRVEGLSRTAVEWLDARQGRDVLLEFTLTRTEGHPLGLEFLSGAGRRIQGLRATDSRPVLPESVK